MKVQSIKEKLENKYHTVHVFVFYSFIKCNDLIRHYDTLKFSSESFENAQRAINEKVRELESKLNVAIDVMSIEYSR